MEERYRRYKWGIQALANARIASSVIQRFITHNLEDLSRDDAEKLKSNLEAQIKKAGEFVEKKVETLSPLANILNFYIPTLSSNKNAVSIQTETPNFNLSVDDALLYIKDFIAGIGYHMGFTPFGDNTQTGKEEDVFLESRSADIRMMVEDYIRHVISVHFRAKYNKEINDSS